MLKVLLYESTRNRHNLLSIAVRRLSTLADDLFPVSLKQRKFRARFRQKKQQVYPTLGEA
jgi:hypothetical protein